VPYVLVTAGSAAPLPGAPASWLDLPPAVGPPPGAGDPSGAIRVPLFPATGAEAGDQAHAGGRGRGCLIGLLVVVGAAVSWAAGVWDLTVALTLVGGVAAVRGLPRLARPSLVTSGTIMPRPGHSPCPARAHQSVGPVLPRAIRRRETMTDLPDPAFTTALEALRVATTALERAAAAPPASDSLPRWLRAREVAAILGLSVQHVYYLMEKRILPTVRINRAVRVPEDELRAYMASLAAEQVPPTPLSALTPNDRRPASGQVGASQPALSYRLPVGDRPVQRHREKRPRRDGDGTARMS
jgi:excisionase family DNA binding protein